jgi:hypothetical protein
MSEEVQTPAQDAVATAAQEVGLSLQDISASVQVIDVVSQRGAIQGNELTAVGQLRDKLVAFLEAAKANGEDVQIPGQEDQAPAEEESAES